MSVRIRKANGELLRLPEGDAAVEVCSTDDKLARVLILGEDSYRWYGPEDREFQLYAAATRSSVADLIQIKP